MVSGIIYEGPSQLDGKPIVVVVTDGTTNEKTGPMLQTWILRTDVAPHVAVESGEDVSVCGDCPQRHSKDGGCYVTVRFAPNTVWKHYKRGGYGRLQPRDLRGRAVRLGAYGDPAAVPVTVWDKILKHASHWTGYTHQWKDARFRKFKKYCMASCDTAADFHKATALGWRTFRAKAPDADRLPKEIVCPASEEGGFRADCFACGACNGTLNGRSVNVVINVHGFARNRALRVVA